MEEMSELKDTAIKLFGKTIALPLNHRRDDVASANMSSSGEAEAATEDSCDDITTGFDMNKSEMEPEGQEGNWETSTEDKADDKLLDSSSNQINEDSKDPTTSGDPKTHSTEGDTKIGEQSETSVSQEKTVKKPDKILPCPRCNSMDTKFCYYNNYNVSQPRHFCKNCQRYWTDGGTMRNVPVGAGRRKNKSSSASHYRHLMVSEALRNHAVNGVHSPSLINNGTVLTFGSDSPLCDSVVSVLNLSENSPNSFRNGYHRPEQRILASRGGVTDNGDDCSSVSSVTANSNSSEKGCNAGKQETTVKNYRGVPPQIPCFSGPPWPSYPWHSAMPPPSFSASGFPVSFYPAPTYWGCTVPSPWNLPSCLSPQSPSLNQCPSGTSPTSPLGKHSRDGHIINPSRSEEPSRESNSSETSVLIPKTLRIDDPNEAAKSSILTTLGIKNEKSQSTNGGGLFRGFRTKIEERNYTVKASSALQANPAALSRSLNFHERNKECFSLSEMPAKW